ncbi:DUF6220 domain-containing protein [Sporosarcina sp. E16_8]|uniref:DUF6220 domain-containing protein n=1 Tax=Sporosarcina sp. E16_8 TaxID=2789295 RepID=UPI001A912BB1|nr:DUF6220 domain-containing protein [Sporosarcina sp. E16_8]MBO0588007.1 hypothetical protein [Sporosarcina sp. E16_8]
MKVIKTRIRVGRFIFLTLTTLFTICILVQVYLAGMAVFGNPRVWVKHIIFVHLFGFNLPILMIIFAVVGSMPRWAYWNTFGIFVSTFLMYFTANINAILPWMGPIHPVLAILLFVLPCSIIIKTWGLINNNRKVRY